MFLSILLSLLNFGLVAIPVGCTVGVLGGIDHYRQNNGKTPLFTEPTDSGSGSSGGGSSGGGSSGNNTSTWDGNKPNTTTVIGGVTVSDYCQQYSNIQVNSTNGQNFTLNPNQWGWTKAEGGSLCLNVTTNNNNTYATNTTAPKWSATWQYPEGSSTQPVHAFPNIMIEGDTLPAKVGSLSKMQVDVQWSYSTGSSLVVGNVTRRSVNNVGISANVAIDMFLDSKESLSSKTSNATYEVMVWFAQFGEYTDPIGKSSGVVASKVVEGVNFTLYSGTNGNKQTVLTWVAADTTTSFNGSIYPLVTALSSLKLTSAPTDTDYLGYFSFGSEAYYSTNTVTFNVPKLALDIW